MKSLFSLLITVCFNICIVAQPLFTATNPACGGSSTITVPPNTFSSYQWNMGNGVTGTNYLPPSTTYNNTSSLYTIQRTVSSNTPFKVINSISVIHTNSFQDCAFEDANPDYYLQIKSSTGTLLHQSNINNNMNAPSNFYFSGILASASLLITIWDYDPSIFCDDDNLGTIALPANVSSGTYQTTNGNIIISLTTQNVTNATYSKTVTLQQASTTINRVCTNNGQSAVLSSSLLGSSYQWSTGATSSAITVNTAGIYRVTVSTAGGCIVTASHSVAISAKPLIACTGTALTCTNYGTSIRWKNASGVTVSNSVTFIPTAPSTYYAEYYGGGNCPRRSSGMLYPSCTIIPSSEAKTDEASEISNSNLAFSIYPNLSNTGIFYIALPSDVNLTEATMEVCDITGKILLSATKPNDNLDLSRYPSGMYFVRFSYNGNINTQKLIIDK